MIKTIIFDQGGILLNINYLLTDNAFKALGASNFDEIYSQKKQTQLFDLYDTGRISSEEFRNTLKKLLHISHITDEDFDTAWNAMLLDLPMRRLNYIDQLRELYSTMIFSNANEIHMIEAEKIFERDTGAKSIAHHFDNVYYSHLCGFRKPYVESFVRILRENNLDPQETLFIDDSIQHIKGASTAGMKTVYLPSDQCIIDSLPKVLEQLHSPIVIMR